MFNNRGNINYIEETNYSILAKNTDVWTGELPFRKGDVFPTASIKERALISNTNRLIYENSVDEIYADIISVFPEIDPMYGWQIREIVTNLPYFKNAINYWTGLIAGEPPIIDGDEEFDEGVSELIESINWGPAIQNSVRSRFMDVIGASRVDFDINGKPTIVPIEAKNLICYVSRTYTGSIEVNVVFNIYTDDRGKKFVEFIEYHYDGKIKKTVFKYENGRLGDVVEDLSEESEAFGGEFKMSPIAIAPHNVIDNQIYGTDQLRYWVPSILGAMRELQNIFRLGERTREMVREVPERAIKKNPNDGSSTFFNRGTVAVPEGQANYPEVKYKVPEIHMEAAVMAFEKAVKSVSIDTNLGPVFFDLEKLGTNLSAKSIEAALYPTKLEAKRITTEMTPYVKELVVKLCALVGIDIKNSGKFSVVWFDGFPKDIKDITDAIQKRLGGKQSISLQDAIIQLDKVPSRVALQKAREIEESNGAYDKKESTVDKIDDDEGVLGGDGGGKLNTHDIAPTATGSIEESLDRYMDNTIWETQMYPIPRDIPVNYNKGVSEKWLKRRLQRKR